MRTTSRHSRTRGLPACTRCLARVQGVCAGAGRNDLGWLERNKSHALFDKGATIARSGSEWPFAGTVLSGLASLSRTQDRGTRQVVGLVHPGDFLGHPGRTTARFDVEALTRVEICAVPIQPFERFLQGVPGMQHRMVEMTLDELDIARAWLGILSRRTARMKLASLLVHFALRQNTSPLPGQGCRVDMMLTREQIADLLSLTFETVSRQLTLLVNEGLLQPVTRRVFLVPDLQALMRASGDDDDGGLKP